MSDGDDLDRYLDRQRATRESLEAQRRVELGELGRLVSLMPLMGPAFSPQWLSFGAVQGEHADVDRGDRVQVRIGHGPWVDFRGTADGLVFPEGFSCRKQIELWERQMREQEAS